MRPHRSGAKKPGSAARTHGSGTEQSRNLINPHISRTRPIVEGLKHTGMSQKHVETARFHVEMTQFHMEKSRTAASVDSKLLARSRCHVEMTCFHMEMSQRCLPLDPCACAPAQNNVDTIPNHMPATRSESALRRNLTSSSRHHMALLQILLDSLSSRWVCCAPEVSSSNFLSISEVLDSPV